MRFIGTLRYYAKRFSSFHISTYAASASFFAITAIFPLLMLILSILSFTPLGTEAFLQGVTRVIPQAFRGIFNFLTEDVMHTDAFALSFSLIATLWTASKSMLGVLDGLNSIADINDTRNFIFKRIVCIVYMLILILGLVIMLALQVFGNAIQSLLLSYLPHLASLFSVLLDLNGLVLFAIIALLLALIYTFFPHQKMNFLMQLPGAFFTSAVWLGFSALYSMYVDHVMRSTSLYGSIGVVIFAMLWVYFCMYIIFLGAVINRLYPSVLKRKQTE